jgi:hypothetical protein
MTKEKEIHYLTECPICGKPIYPFSLDHDGHCHIIHKTPNDRIAELEERVTALENSVENK